MHHLCKMQGAHIVAYICSFAAAILLFADNDDIVLTSHDTTYY